MQETSFLVQIVLKIWFLAFDLALHGVTRRRASRASAVRGGPRTAPRPRGERWRSRGAIMMISEMAGALRSAGAQLRP
eukprot:1314203-Rhodomonas_salina.4